MSDIRERAKVSFDEIRAINKRVNDLDNQKWAAQQELASVLDPLFSAQHKMAYAILKEPQFEDLYKSSPYHGPIYDLVGQGQETVGYYEQDGHYFSDRQYRDGEGAKSAKLLPEFIDGTEEEQGNAIRRHFIEYQEAKAAEARAQEDRDLEKAIALLKAAGKL